MEIKYLTQANPAEEIEERYADSFPAVTEPLLALLDEYIELSCFILVPIQRTEEQKKENQQLQKHLAELRNAIMGAGIRGSFVLGKYGYAIMVTIEKEIQLQFYRFFSRT
jgi:hypothetical protein